MPVYLQHLRSVQRAAPRWLAWLGGSLAHPSVATAVAFRGVPGLSSVEGGSAARPCCADWGIAKGFIERPHATPKQPMAPSGLGGIY